MTEDTAIIGKRIIKEPEHADWKHLADKPRPVMGPTELGSFAETVAAALDLFDAQQAFRCSRGHASVAAWFMREQHLVWQRRPWPSLPQTGSANGTAEGARETAAQHQTAVLNLAAAPTTGPADDTAPGDEASS